MSTLKLRTEIAQCNCSYVDNHVNDTKPISYDLQQSYFPILIAICLADGVTAIRATNS